MVNPFLRISFFCNLFNSFFHNLAVKSGAAAIVTSPFIFVGFIKLIFKAIHPPILEPINICGFNGILFSISNASSIHSFIEVFINFSEDFP